MYINFHQELDVEKGIYSAPPPNVFTPPVTNYMLLYRTLLYKNYSTCAWGRKRYKPTKLGRGQNRIDREKTQTKQRKKTERELFETTVHFQSFAFGTRISI